MKKRTIASRIFLGGLLVLTVISGLAYGRTRNVSELTVDFLDIGQGDAVYIRTSSGKDMLIDGGPSVTVLRRLAEVMPWYDRSLDVVLATHPDADHIGGLPSVIERYEVGLYIESGAQSKNAIDDKIARLLEEKQIKALVAKRGMRINFGDGAVFDILFPDTDMSSTTDTNSASIIGQMRYGSTAVMLTGDAPKASENKIMLLDKGRLKSDVLKAGHHGSKTSSGESFVRAVAPEYVVISAGKDNRYGHPNAEVVEVFKKLNVSMLRTDGEGTIRFVSNGEKFVRNEK